MRLIRIAASVVALTHIFMMMGCSGSNEETGTHANVDAAEPLIIRISEGHGYGKRQIESIRSFDGLSPLLQSADAGEVEQAALDRITFEDSQVVFVGAELNYEKSSVNLEVVRDHGDSLEIAVSLIEAPAQSDRSESPEYVEPALPRFHALLVNVPEKPFTLTERFVISPVILEN